MCHIFLNKPDTWICQIWSRRNKMDLYHAVQCYLIYNSSKLIIWNFYFDNFCYSFFLWFFMIVYLVWWCIFVEYSWYKSLKGIWVLHVFFISLIIWNITLRKLKLLIIGSNWNFLIFLRKHANVNFNFLLEAQEIHDNCNRFYP